MSRQVIGMAGKGEPQGDWWTGVKEIVAEHDFNIKVAAVRVAAGLAVWYFVRPLVVNIAQGAWSVGKFFVTNPITTKGYVPIMTGVVGKNIVDNYLGVNKEDHAHKKFDQHLESVINVAAWEATNKHSFNKQLNKQGDIHYTNARLTQEYKDFFSTDDLLSMMTPGNAIGVLVGIATLVIPGAWKVAMASNLAVGLYNVYDHYYGSEDSGELKVVGDATSHD